MKTHYITGKTIIKLLLMIFIILLSANLQAGDKIKIKLHQPPPNKLGTGDVWKLDITNLTRDDIKVFLTGNLSEAKDGLIVDGKSKVFTVKPGKSTYGYDDFKSGEVNWKNKSYQEVIIRTGNVKEGNYTICVTALFENGDVADQESCIEQSVQQMGSITLISPEDGIESTEDTSIMFAWTPLPKGGPYSLRIVELKGDQSPDVAIKESRPILDKEGIKVTTYQYGLTDPKLEAGKKYAWQVTSGDVHSDIYKITFKMRRPPLNQITLISPKDEEEFNLDTLPGLTFSWEKCPLCPPMFTLKIVEIKGEQSPDVAIKENTPVCEIKDIKSTSIQGDPVHGIVIKRGLKYAWQVSSGDVQSDVYTVILKMKRPPLNQLKLISPKDSDNLIIGKDSMLFEWEFKRDVDSKGRPSSLRIVELISNESPENAILNNPAVLEIENIKTTSYELSIQELDLLKPGKTYAWHVTNGDLVSDVRIIKGPPIHPTNPNEPGISLVSPTNGQEIDPDTLPGLLFSWKRNDPCPPHMICKYTFRIVEVMDDQSPEYAIQNNKPVYEKIGITTDTVKINGVINQDALKNKRHRFAWQVTSGDAVSVEIRELVIRAKN